VAAGETATTLTVTATSTVAPSIYGTATVTVPAVNSVTVTPATTTVITGATQPFTAAVSVTGGLAQTVTWAVTGNTSTSTTINNAGLLTVAADETAGTTLTVTATSTADTSKSGTATVTVILQVTALSLDGKVTAPVRGVAPVTTAIDETQYTGNIVWQTENGTSFNGSAFGTNTVYKAVVALAAKTGYTFTGVEANSFTYGTNTVTNAADSGTVTITFPATGPGNATVNIGGNPSVRLYLDGATDPLELNGTSDITKGLGTFTVNIDSAYTAITWRVNGTVRTETTTSIELLKRAGVTYYVEVEATAGGVKNSGAHTFVVSN
jgi:hypothetical protein